jgi:YidC/Oxa1 family membrane protein insertase
MKNYLIGIILLVVGVFLFWRQGTEQMETAEQDAKEAKKSSPPPAINSSGDQNQSLFDQNVTKPLPVALPEGNVSVAPVQVSPEQTTIGLENDHSSLEFSNHTGGLREVRLKKYDRLSQNYNMTNEGEPLLSISFEDENGRLLAGIIPDPKAFKLIENTSRKVLYRWELPGKLKIEREYIREGNSTYVFDHKTSITNLGTDPLLFERMRFHLGSAFQIPRRYNPFDSTETYLNVGYYNSGAPLTEGCSCAKCSGRIDGETEEFFQYNEMGATGELEIKRLGLARWACVNNQFFVNIVRPKNELANAWVRGRNIRGRDSTAKEEIKGVEGSISFPLGILKPGASKSFEFQVYAGPKDYVGLSDLQFEQKKVMQFGIFWWISEPFSWMLNKLHSLLGSYGLAIIALTILLKLCLWPLTAKATRSQKKMQALQGPMGEIKEKHKGNPQKLNQEMMKFYKENKVNPFAGCWPILIQMPIFLGMFWMLRSAAELYGQGFLWAGDLSEQDSIAVLQGFSINLLPILMVASQWYQMKLNPMQMGPEMSDAQRINAKMMRLMPFMFLVFLYFFSSALVLYWTVQNLMTIMQTLITKRDPLPNEEIQNINSNVADGDEDEISVRSELSDEEKRCRNLLGLRAKGPIEANLLERKYQERLQNYSESKLAQMSPTKKEQALEKKDRLEKAYQFLLEQIDKQT